MKMTRKYLTGLAFACAIGLGSQAADAATFNITFDFTSPQADAASYVFADVGSGLILTVTPATFVGNVITNLGLVTMDGSGLGVSSPGDGNPKIDAEDLNDLAKFSFSGAVTLSEITFNNTDPNDSFRFFHDSNNDNSLTDNGTFNPQNHPTGLVLLGSLFPGLVSGDLFGFGALLNLACNSCNNNEWRIGSLKLDYTPPGQDPGLVPLPAALPLFAAGLGGLAWLSRRKPRKLSTQK